MSIDADRKTAVDELDKLLVYKGQAQRLLNAQAKMLRTQAMHEDDQPLRKALERQANDFTRQAIALNRQNFRLLHMRNRILKSTSLFEALEALRVLNNEAEEVLERMEQISKIIDAVTDLIDIIIRFSKLVV